MTLQELYQNIGGDYDQALSVLRIEKLMDKHIRRFPENGVVERLLNAETSVEFFEAGHAMKGVCANLGLTGLAEAASEITEEFRPGNERKLSDAEVLARIEKIRELYNSTAEGIQRYIMS